MLFLLQTHLRDFIVWLVAFIVTTFAGVELGLMSSIALSLLILVLESSFPHTAQLGRIGKSNVYRSAGTDIQKYFACFFHASVICGVLRRLAAWRLPKLEAGCT
jgi:MFS superfamily sulfate permease-like transporter